MSSVPAPPSSTTVVPSATLSAPSAATTAGHAQRPGQDRGVAGRAALGGDEAEHLLRVDGRGVGRREVAGDEDERVAGVRDAGHRDAEHGGDDPVADVLDVGHARADVAACRGEHVAEGVGGLEHGAGRRQVPLDHAGDREVHHPRVDRHVRRRLEHGPRLGLRLLGTGAQLGGHRLHGGRDPGPFRVLVRHLRRAGGRLRHRIGHPHQRTDRDTRAHSDSVQQRHDDLGLLDGSVPVLLDVDGCLPESSPAHATSRRVTAGDGRRSRRSARPCRRAPCTWARRRGSPSSSRPARSPVRAPIR